jgi:hypothetical protein
MSELEHLRAKVQALETICTMGLALHFRGMDAAGKAWAESEIRREAVELAQPLDRPVVAAELERIFAADDDGGAS